MFTTEYLERNDRARRIFSGEQISDTHQGPAQVFTQQIPTGI
jgi:hypothetical protein